ncbi:MAG: RNB domain-containing ribonuclease [Lentisphaeria bacterium]|nr:RNB domain-containing ribonuclease [Lentisphaeria bacterium]
MEYEGKIVGFLSGGKIRIGHVVRASKSKLQVQSEDGRSERVAAKQLVALHPGGDVASVRGSVEALRVDMELELLWEEMLERGGEPNLSEMSDAYFGNTEPVSLMALAGALLSDPAHFRSRGVDFAPRSREEAAEIEELKRRRSEKAARRERVLEWLSIILSLKKDDRIDVPEDLTDFVRQASEFLLCGHNSEATTLLHSAHKKRPAPEVALAVLTHTGSLPEGTDPFLLVNGIHAGFSKAVLEAADALPSYVPDPDRADYTALEAFSIDDEVTREVDDAISVERDGDDILIGVHIADPSYFVEKDAPLDRVAKERPLTLYLPTTTALMLPDRISCDLASLSVGATRPSLSFLARFGADCVLKDWSFSCAQVKLSRRLTYVEADALIAGGENDSMGSALRSLLPIVSSLRKERMERGAFVLRRPEMRVRVHGEEIEVVRQQSDTPSHDIVSELMVLANGLSALYALRNDIPVIYRVQDPPNSPVQSVLEYDPVAFGIEIRKLRRTRLSTHPQGHTGLGLDVYIQVTSPIRRYADLVMQRQLAAHLRGDPLPYELNELFEIVSNVDSTSVRHRGLEREANRHWMLEYLLRDRLGDEFDAVVVGRNERQTFAELDEVFERGQIRTKEDRRVGDRLRAKVVGAQPKDGILLLEEV